MENPRPEKVAAVAEVTERFNSSSSVMVTEYRGMTVDALSQMRRELREAGGYYKVYKNSLVRRAAKDAGLELDEHLLGPVALAFTEKRPDGTDGDVVTVAKTLKDYSKKYPELVIKAGYFEGNLMDADAIKQLADIEPREVLLAKFAGLLQAPMSKFAQLLNALPTNFAYGLQALIDQGGAPGAPASEVPVAAEPAAETEVAVEPDAAKEEDEAAEPVAEVEESTEAPAEAKAESNEQTDSKEAPASDESQD